MTDPTPPGRTPPPGGPNAPPPSGPPPGTKAGRFAALTAQFLGQSPVPLGYVPYDAHARAAARDQVPVVRRSAPLRAALAGITGALAPLLPARA